MNRYETIIVIDPNIEAEYVEKIIDDVQNLISGSGGKVSEVDKWGKRRLAYEVEGNRDGIYILINFEAEPEFVRRLARYYGLTEQIIKYITVRAEDLPEPVVEVESEVDDGEDDDSEDNDSEKDEE